MPPWPNLARGLSAADREGPGAALPEPGEWRHGWQFLAADARELRAVNEWYGRLSPTGQALLLSQSGAHAGDGLAALPTGEDTRAPHFVTTLRRRAWLPLGLGEGTCPGCGAQLDVYGFHLLSCMFSGRVRKRAAEQASGRSAQSPLALPRLRACGGHQMAVASALSNMNSPAAPSRSHRRPPSRRHGLEQGE